MKRRSFIGALVATFATPAKMLEQQVPLAATGFVPVGVYTLTMHKRMVEELKRHAQPLEFMPMFKGEIGSYETVRFIRSKT